MKKLLLLLAFPLLVHAQTATQNYIKTTAYKVPTTEIIATPTTAQAAVNVTYYDVLGRPIQQVAWAQSASGKDIVTPFEYDGYGRQPRQFLSYPKSQVRPFPNTSSTMSFDPAAITNVQTYYTDMFTAPNSLEQDDAFSESVFEESPLNRVLEQGAPGADWKVSPIFSAPHTVRREYLNNSTADGVKLFKVPVAAINASGYYPIALTQAVYAANELSKSVVKDENWVDGVSGKNNTTEEYTNKEGQLVLKRTFNAGVAHDTYYVYDTFGKLTYVIPPLASGGTIDATVLDNLCYQYRYDYRNRLVEKKLPGKQWEFIVYDRLDRVVATGPAPIPVVSPGMNSEGWLVTKYDGYGRPVYTGWYWGQLANAATRVTLQGLYSGISDPAEKKTAAAVLVDDVGVNYTNAVFPTTSFKLLTVSYYDDYDFPGAPVIPATVLTDASQEVYYNNTTARPKGMPTGSWVRAMTTSLATRTSQWETSYILYDIRSRPVRSYTANYLGGFTQVDSKLDFTGKVLYSETTHKRLSTDAVIYVKDSYTYSLQDRPLAHNHQIGATGTPQLISLNTYNELGELIKKQVGNTQASPLQTVDYRYNIRGWLTDINDISRTGADLFSYNVNYQQNNSPYVSGDTAGKPLYNGNISMVNWSTDNNAVGMKAYFYRYDNLNRFVQGQYSENDVVNNKYLESLAYDKNGNITQLSRAAQSTTVPTGAQNIDNLSYRYSGNRLLGVTDAYGLTAAGVMGFTDNNTVGDDYGYDNNGNMTADKNKNITLIIYNHLNLPVKIVFNSADIGTASPKVIEYQYNAAGIKIQKKVTESATVTTTQYLGGYTYLNGVLQFFPHSEGYVSNVGGTYKYVFQYTDHLGNVRLSYADSDGNGSITGASSELFYSGFENSGWESLSDPYHFGGAVTYDTGRKHSGTASGRIDTPPVDQERYVQTNTRMAVSNTVPTQYVFSGWVYCDNNMLSADILLLEYKAGETLYLTRGEELRTSVKNRWVYIQKIATVQPDIVELALRVDNNGGGLVWFDDVSIRKVNTGNEIVEENSYYPFGLKHGNNVLNLGNNGNAGAQKYKYNGKEYQDELGLNLYDYGARNYMADIGRWGNMDAKSENFSFISPYTYVANNPMMFIDPDGEDIFIPNVTGNPNGAANSRNKGTILSNLQKLSNNTLELTKTRGGYLVKDTGTKFKGNSAKKLSEGTGLINRLSTSKKRVTIQQTKEGETNMALPLSNGNSLIKVDLKNKADGTYGNKIQNADGTYGRPVEIGLGHELGHAEKQINGEVDKTMVVITNPDSNTNPEKDKQGKMFWVEKDEVNARDFENKIRDEQGIVPRAKATSFIPQN